jgi:hypothetical protein
MRARVSLGLWVLLIGSGCGTSTTPPIPPCDATCQAADAGHDAGTADAGSADAGPDAGVDAGLDAGSVDAGAVDAGFDAGPVDAGPVDAGLPDAGPTGCQSDNDCSGFTPHCETTSGACVECVLDSHCFLSVAPTCDHRTNTCVGCVSGANCANPTPACDVTQQCVGCTTNAECGAGRLCVFPGTCNGLNDTCATARVLAFPSSLGTFSFADDPSIALDDLQVSCNATGPELVYTFTTTVVRDFQVTVAPLTGSQSKPVVALRSACATASSEVACDAPASGGAALQVKGLAPGTWSLIVETANGAPGPVQIDVHLLAQAQPPANDTCTTPQALTFYGSTATIIGDTSLATNDSTTAPSCSATAHSGPDLQYTYTLATKSTVSISARPVSGSSLHPVLALQSSCGGPELACQAAASATPAQLSLPVQQPGTWSVMVDSADGTLGAFELQVIATPIVDNDTCASPTALTFVGSTASATGDTTFATNGNAASDSSPGCSSSARSSGQDVVFTYTLTQARDVTIAVTPTGASPTFEPVVSIRSACSNATSAGELGCVSPLAPTVGQLTLVNQPAGTYTVWVDGANGSLGPFQLEVVTASPTPPPANDTCASPAALTFTNGTSSVSGSTAQAANDNSPYDLSPTCSASGKQSGRDVVYSFTLSQPQDVTFTLAPAAGSTLAPVLYVRRGTCASQLLTDEVVCVEQATTITSTVTALAAGTYFVFVDSAGGTSGAFSLTTTLAPPTPAPANDTCAAPQALTFVGGTATASGTTVGATNSNTPSDNSPACGTGFLPRRYGRDLVYTFTLTAPQDVDVRVTPTAGSAFVPAVYARTPNACTSFSAGTELGCVASTSPVEAELYLPNLPAGTYPLFVDSNSYDTGGFTLTVKQLPPTLPPSNDTCAAPTALTAGVAVTGSTIGAKDDFSLGGYPASCGLFLNTGRDVTYSFTAPTTGTVTATITPAGLYDPSLLLLAPSCGAAACARASNVGGPGVPESLSFAVTAGQTFFLVVDSADGSLPNSSGQFSLVVQ